MQFNSFIFVLLFLPVTVMAYFLLNKWSFTIGKSILLLASIVFYAYSDWTFLIILGISLMINFAFAKIIEKIQRWNRVFLVIPVLTNIGLLLYFKYSNFMMENFNLFLGKKFSPKEIALPLGISFFTFQQIAYIVVLYKNEIKKADIVDYLVYILFFPKILMGPLAEPVDFIGQLNDPLLKKINWDNIVYGIKIFSFGLFKKLMIADVFAKAVSWGYENIGAATSMDWILVMLFYTFEIYFDFSGYSDMAVGTSVMFNVTLPINFDSPYKAISIRDFWKRWHISLTQFFTKYIYIPLGGNQKGKVCTVLNIMAVFLISGIWHGANWTFILWGTLHGAFSVFDRYFDSLEKKIFEPLRWFFTFSLVNVLWLLFRSETISQWKGILGNILSLENTTISSGLLECFVLPEMPFLTDILHIGFVTTSVRGFWLIFFTSCSLLLCLIPKNNYYYLRHKSGASMILAAIAFVWSIICLSNESVFVYLNF